MAKRIQVRKVSCNGVEIPIFEEGFKPFLGNFKSNLELFEYYYKIATDPNIDPKILHEYASLCNQDQLTEDEYKNTKKPFRYEVMRLALDYLFCKNKSYELVADKDLNDFFEKYLPFFNYGKPKDEWEFCLNDWLFVTIALADLRVMNS